MSRLGCYELAFSKWGLAWFACFIFDVDVPILSMSAFLPLSLASPLTLLFSLGTNRRGYTILDIAASKADLEMVSTLIRHGARPRFHYTAELVPSNAHNREAILQLLSTDSQPGTCALSPTGYECGCHSFGFHASSRPTHSH